MTAKDISYHPDCFLCRKEAGKSPAGVSETHLCRSHVQSEWLKEKAEAKRLTKENMEYFRYVQDLCNTGFNIRKRAEAAEAEAERLRSERDALEKRVREWQAENSVLRGLLQKGTVDRGSFTQYIGEATVKTPQELDPDHITLTGTEEVKP